MRAVSFLLLVLLFSAGGSAGERVYRWVDADGHVHYSGQRPQTGEASVVESAAPGPARVPTTTDVKKFLDEADAANKAAADEKTLQQKVGAESRVVCDAARKRVDYLDERTARRLAIENPDGTMTRMDEAEFDKRRAAGQKDIDDHCR